MSGSDDEVEILDTPPRSRITAAAGTGASSPISGNSGGVGGAAGRGWKGAGRGRSSSSSSSSSSSVDYDEFSVDNRSLMARCELRKAPSTAAASATGSSSAPPSGAANGNRPRPGASGAAAATAAAAAGRATAVVNLSSGEEEEEDSDGYDGLFKGKGKAERPVGRGGNDSGSGGGAAADNNSSRNDGDEEEGYMACKQDKDVVELVSSDDEVGAAAAARASTKPKPKPYLGDSDSDSDSDSDDEELAAGTSMTPLDLGLDSLALASQTSSVSVSSSSRAGVGGAASSSRTEAGAGAGAGPAPGDPSREGGGGGRGGINDSDTSGAIGVLDDSGDEFSLECVGGGGSSSGARGKGASSSSSSTSRKVPASGGGGGAAAAAAAASKQDKAANKKRQRSELRAAAKELKEQEKHEKAQKRVADRAQRAQQDAKEKAQRAEDTKRAKQARGNFMSMEIACVMERGFFGNPRNARALAGTAEQPTGKPNEKFMVAAGDCDVPGAIWWTRRDYLEGGAAVSGRGVQTLDILVVVVPPARLLGCLVPAGGGRGAADGNVFPGLGRFVDSIRTSANGFSRLVLVLEGAKEELDRQWAASARSGGKGPASGGCTRDDFEDAQCWLLIHKDVETRLTKDGEETGQYLWDLTRALSSLPYDDEVTELHCVPRSKVEARGSDQVGAEEKKLMDTWVKMLKQVQEVSESRAVEIATHFPLPRDLMAVLSDPAVPEPDRAGLLTRKMGGSKNQPLASKRIFQLFTQEDGDFVIA